MTQELLGSGIIGKFSKSMFRVLRRALLLTAARLERATEMVVSWTWPPNIWNRKPRERSWLFPPSVPRTEEISEEFTTAEVSGPRGIAAPQTCLVLYTGASEGTSGARGSQAKTSKSLGIYCSTQTGIPFGESTCEEGISTRIIHASADL